MVWQVRGGKTQGRIRKEANDGDQANDKRTIDEYNRIIGLGGIIQPMYAGFMIYKVRQALEDPNNWKSIITGCKEDYSKLKVVIMYKSGWHCL